MSGLLTKDFRLLIQRKESFILFIVMAAFMGYAMDGTFVVGYLTLLGATLGIGTLSYDEMDNGLPFIMSWPVTRKTYVGEKFLFSFLTAFVAWVLGAVTYVVISMVKNNPIDFIHELPGVLVYLPVILLILSIMLPVELKFGPEKSRIILIVVFGAIGAGLVFASGIVGAGENKISQLAALLNNYHPVMIIGIMIAVCLAVCLISLLLTIKIVERKEF